MEMSRPLQSCLLILVLAAKPGIAQNITSVSATAAGYFSDHPEGGPIGLGFALSVERQRASWTYRGVITGLNTVVMGDDIALCHLLPDESCLPDSVFPASLWSLEGLTLVRPLARVPVQVLTGLGVAIPVGRRAGTNGSDVSDVRASVRGTWRFGGELQLGRGSRAARVQLSRSSYSSRLMSLTGLVTLQLQLSL
jgi:hypothetical protein